MPKKSLIPRQIRCLFHEAIGDSPVILIHGPRQCGKTTLAKSVAKSSGFPISPLTIKIPDY
ncbi:MAG: AAA family ATPase [Bacteroidetes bacterium]|nr:AAA family ATPase [Bacteroidota bacterium]MCY4204504.1 AAA family ATPase [Bacteroidota bacterium]